MNYLACDLGAESGRLMLGTVEGGRLRLDELGRFPNTPLQEGPSLCWNIASLREGLLDGLRLAARRQPPLAAISTDSWGVDYVLLDQQGELMPPAFHYRDPRCQQGVENAHSRVSWEQMFAETGLQFLPFNTAYQLMSEPPERLQSASRMLGIADAFNYILSGTAVAELSYASTTQLYNPLTRRWAEPLIARLGLPAHLFPSIVPSGTVLAPIRPELSQQTELPPIKVIASCSHDTGAAVAAIPAQGTRWAYLSSGTWSLMGVELPEPILNEQCREYNFTNEIGYGHSVRLLKNIIGLWLIQECRRHWASQGAAPDYATLTELAAQASPFAALINPADSRFVAPGDMPSRIAQYCRETHQHPPTGPGPTVRCALESLALLYRRVLRQLESLLGYSFEVLHIVGGGSKNALLNQFTANATQVPVVAGPAEATAAGNILIQALALGELPSLSEARALMKRSVSLQMYLPDEGEAWQRAAARFESMGN